MAKLFTAQRAMIYARQQGWRVAKVEQTIAPPGRRAFRRDAFGFIDLIVLRPDECVAVQACQHKDTSDHLLKLRTDEKSMDNLAAWISVAGCVAELWAMKKVLRGKAVRWMCQSRDLSELLSPGDTKF